MFKMRTFYITLTMLILISIVFIPVRSYYINSKPITSGNEGYSCIYLLTFKHESLMPYLKTAQSKKGLYLLDSDFIERNTDVIEVLIEQNHAIGLISYSNDDEDYNESILRKELAVYEKTFNSKPLWLTTEDGQFHNKLINTLHASSINGLGISTLYDQTLDLKNIPAGTFIFIRADSTFNFQSKMHLQLVDSKQFRSIEENLFGIKTKSQDMP